MQTNLPPFLLGALFGMVVTFIYVIERNVYLREQMHKQFHEVDDETKAIFQAMMADVEDEMKKAEKEGKDA